MVVLPQGKTLSPGDLNLAVRDPGTGGFIDPVSITYTILQELPTGTSVAVGPNAIPVRSQQGVYYVPLTIPVTWEGKFKLIWYLQQYAGSEVGQTYEEFEVVVVDPVNTSFEAASTLLTSRPGISKKLACLIMMVRELLGDENPDRNYRFGAVTPGRPMTGLNSRVGFIWTDSTIARMLAFAIAQLNTWNPMSLYNYTIDTIPENWMQAAALGAAVRCLSKEAAVWTNNGISYSLNGVSLDLNGKAASYQSLADDFKAEFQEWAPLITANRPCSVGVRQAKYLF